jgi:hypothetical protein
MSKLAIRPYHHGLQDLGDGIYAWLQPTDRHRRRFRSHV